MVRNDHVLAIVRIKGEELEKRELALSNLATIENVGASTSHDEEVEREEVEDDDEESALPKLTRAKAKALNKYPLPVAPIKHSEPNSEVMALIQDELHSDDDDEEYQPGEDDIEVGWNFSLFFLDLECKRSHNSCISRMTISIRPHLILIHNRQRH